MKTQNLLVLGALCLGLAFVACQKEELAKPNNGDNQITVRNHDCSVVCLDPENVVPFEHSDFVQEIVGNPVNGNYRQISYTFYNDLSNFVVEWAYTTAGVGGNRQIRVNIGGGPVTPAVQQTVAAVAPGSSGSFSFPLSEGWAGCDDVNFSVSAVELPSNVVDFTESNSYDLVGECGCEIEGNVFTGEAGAGSCDGTRSATYTFGSEDGEDYVKIQGGLNNFTGGDATVTVSGGTLINQDQWTPGQSSNRIIRVEVSLIECETVTISIAWNSGNPCDEDGCTITGEWSAKDEHGVDLAPAVPDLICSPE